MPKTSPRPTPNHAQAAAATAPRSFAPARAHARRCPRAHALGRTLTATLALLLTLVALAGCGSSHTNTDAHSAKAKAAPSKVGANANSTALLPGGIPQIVNRVEPEVVTVLTHSGLGSGVIYRANGVILTDDHVVKGSKTVEVAFADGQRVGGQVIAADPDTDLSLVRVKRTRLPAARFQTAPPAVGSLAVVLGSPLGLENSVTAGIVSGLHRSIPSSGQQASALVDLMQTDAPISPGNSGGAVVNGQGKVIGISEAYIPPEAGAVAIGFAIPAATAVSIANQLLETGHVRHAFLGVEPAQLTPQIAQALGLRQTSGVLVYGVERGGPAARAHVQPGDIIVAFDGKPTDTVDQLFVALRKHHPGQVVKLTLVRGNHRLSVDLRLSNKPQ